MRERKVSAMLAARPWMHACMHHQCVREGRKGEGTCSNHAAGRRIRDPSGLPPQDVITSPISGYLVPLAVLAFCLTVGIIGILSISNATYTQRQNEALMVATAASSNLVDALYRAALPGYWVATWIKDVPQYQWPAVEAVRAAEALQCVRDTSAGHAAGQGQASGKHRALPS
jgi:hypothetical protein